MKRFRIGSISASTMAPIINALNPLHFFLIFTPCITSMHVSDSRKLTPTRRREQRNARITLRSSQDASHYLLKHTLQPCLHKLNSTIRCTKLESQNELNHQTLRMYKNVANHDLETLENVDSTATAVFSKAVNVVNADLLRLVWRRRSAFSDRLGALAALLKNGAATELAVERVGLNARLVTLNLEGSGETSSGDSESKEVLEVHFRFLFFVQHLRAHTAFYTFCDMNSIHRPQHPSFCLK